MFQIIAGFSAGECVRRRRLSLAARELAAGREKVIDLAVRLGNDSPDAFAKAFERELGVTPSEAREPGFRLKTWPRFSFSIILKGEAPMNFRIENKEAVKITGIPLRTTTKGDAQFKDIPVLWGATMENGRFQGLIQSMPTALQDTVKRVFT
jgi:AraC family transcriptional regulator